jgi:hypothetical protein
MYKPPLFIYIQWNEYRRSPYIGGYTTLGEARKAAHELRLVMRETGAPWQNRVMITVNPFMSLEDAKKMDFVELEKTAKNEKRRLRRKQLKEIMSNED